MTVRSPVPAGNEVLWATRKELRRLDRELVELLAERLGLVQQLWAHKRTVGLPLEDPAQEGRVLRRARRLADRSGIEPTFVEAIFRAVISEGKRMGVPGPRRPLRSRPDVVESRPRRSA
ncbi:MAG: chorismate mutase [Thermoplasmata archaeon]